MKDPRLASCLLESSPDALAELFDAYGDRLFRYCWGMLRSRSRAQVALRDTLLVAQARIARLADPEDPASLAPWLYSLARGVPPAPAGAPGRRGRVAGPARPGGRRCPAGVLERRDEPDRRRIRGARPRLPVLRGPRPGPRPARRGSRRPAGRPGHLVGPAERFRFLVAPAPVAARA